MLVREVTTKRKDWFISFILIFMSSYAFCGGVLIGAIYGTNRPAKVLPKREAGSHMLQNSSFTDDGTTIHGTTNHYARYVHH